MRIWDVWSLFISHIRIYLKLHSRSHHPSCTNTWQSEKQLPDSSHVLNPLSKQLNNGMQLSGKGLTTPPYPRSNSSDHLPFMFILRGQTLVNLRVLSNCELLGWKQADHQGMRAHWDLEGLLPLHWFTCWHQNWWGIKLATVQEKQIGQGDGGRGEKCSYSIKRSGVAGMFGVKEVAPVQLGGRAVGLLPQATLPMEDK